MSGKLDPPNPYNKLSSYISLFIQGKTSSDLNKKK